MVFKYILAISILLFSYTIYSIIDLLDINKPLRYINNENCEKIHLPMATEDLAVFGDLLIGATFDSTPSFYKHFRAADTKPGFLISIDPKNKAAKKIKVNGFPQEFQINGHGLKLYNKTLYVISHGYAKGGERILVFELELVGGEVEATYKDSFYFEGDHGIYNNLALVDDKHFYMTQWLPFPDSVEGRDNTFIVGLKRILTQIYLTHGEIKFCTITGKSQVSCETKAHGHIPNGVYYNKNQLFVADSIQKGVRIYNVKENFDLELKDIVSIGHSVDNIWGVNGELYIAGFNRIVDYIKFTDALKAGRPTEKMPGGGSKMYLKDGKWTVETVIMQDLLDLATTIVVTDKIFLSSIHDSELLVCSKSIN